LGIHLLQIALALATVERDMCADIIPQKDKRKQNFMMGTNLNEASINRAI
jgi:hypothetical protein